MKKIQQFLMFVVSLGLLCVVLSFSPFFAVQTIELTPQQAETAAEKIVQESQKEAPKAQFGDTESGDALIDHARENARIKLERLNTQATDSPKTEILQKPVKDPD